MSEQTHARGPAQRVVEIAVCIFTAVFALVVIAGSMQAGAGWASDGPRAGFFPFYIGLTILGASLINLVQIMAAGPSRQLFAEWGQLVQVLRVLIPTIIYVVLIPRIGIYVSSALLIGFFMKWLGRYAWTQVLFLSIIVPVVTFAIFEKWFMVPLPKGWLEELLGF